MATGKDTEVAEGQLDRILEFFPRVESKVSAIFAIDTALLGFILLNLKPGDLANLVIAVPAALAITSLLFSAWYCYRTIFPNLDGGERSLIYFREIAQRTETSFIDDFEALSEADYRQDLLAQVWRNSAILKLKFDYVKKAFSLMAISLLPLLVFSIATSLGNGRMPILG